MTRLVCLILATNGPKRQEFLKLYRVVSTWMSTALAYRVDHLLTHLRVDSLQPLTQQSRSLMVMASLQDPAKWVTSVWRMSSQDSMLPGVNPSN